METVEKIIRESRDVREVKRALSIKMGKIGLKPREITEILQVSEQYVSKWKGIHEKAGAEKIRIGYEGSQGYLTKEEKDEVVRWVEEQDRVGVEEIRDHIETAYRVIYKSRQSYYDLLQAGGMSYHRTTIVNPKKDEEKILEKRAEIKKKWLNTKKK